MNYTIHKANMTGPSCARDDIELIVPMLSSKRDAISLAKSLSVDNPSIRYFVKCGSSIIASAYRGRASHYHQY